MKAQDNFSRTEIPKLCHSFTSSTELAWGQLAEVRRHVPPGGKIHMLQMSQDKSNWTVITYKHIFILTSNENNSSLQRWQIAGQTHRAALCRRVLCPICHARRNVQDRVTTGDTGLMHEKQSTNLTPLFPQTGSE